MTPRTPLRELGLVLERLLEEPDAGRRERLLARCVYDAGLAGAVAMYAEGEPWRRLLGCGDTDILPGADLVASVAEGQIGPELPPDRMVVVGGSAPRRRALALAGGLVDEQRADLLEALLMFLSCLDSIDPEGDLDDRVLPPFQRAERRSPGGEIAHDLRALLRSIRGRQDELELLEGCLGEDELEELAEVMDRECQLAGDLLLDAFASAGAGNGPVEKSTDSAPATHSPWRRIFEEIAETHARHHGEAGCTLRVSAIDPGALELNATEGDYRILVETLVDLALQLRGTLALETQVVDLSLLPLRRDGVVGLELCAESARHGGPARASEASQVAALRERVDRLGGRMRCALPDSGVARVALWLPAA